MNHSSFIGITFLVLLAVHLSLTSSDFDQSADFMQDDLNPSVHNKDNNAQENVEWRRQSESNYPAPSAVNNGNRNKPPSRKLQYDFLRNIWVIRKAGR